jgi:hypothetical protein
MHAYCVRGTQHLPQECSALLRLRYQCYHSSKVEASLSTLLQPLGAQLQAWHGYDLSPARSYAGLPQNAPRQILADDGLSGGPGTPRETILRVSIGPLKMRPDGGALKGPMMVVDGCTIL